MRRSVFAVILGLVLAFALAGFLALILRLPLADWRISEHPLLYVARALFPIAAFALPFAIAAIGLSEARRVRGLAYWLFVGTLIGILGYIAVVGGSPATRPAYQTMRTFFALAAMGLAGGFVYWWVAGRHAGRVAAALSEAASGRGGDEQSRRRCWWCGVSGLALSLVPLALLGWYAIYRPAPMLPEAIIARSEADATVLLGKAGVQGLSMKIEDHIGRITGHAASETDRVKTFDVAKSVLAPMVGVPGVVAYLQNDISVTQGAAEPAPEAAQAAAQDAAQDAAKRQAEADAAAKLAAQKVAEAAAAAKAADDAGQAALDAAKRKSDEIIQAAERAAAEKAEAERKAEEEARLAAEAEAKRKAEEEARLAAEAEAKRKAEEEARLAAEAEAKRKAEEEARLAADKASAEKAEAERVARATAEAERLAREAQSRKDTEEAEARAAAEQAAKEKALEDARRIAEAEAERKAVEAAHAAEAEAKAKSTTADASCATDFSDLFKSDVIRFPFRSTGVSAPAAAYLDRVAALARRCASYDVTIGGHSDRSGSESYNTRVSIARAEAVRNALIARGIAAERLTAEGYGAQRPFDPGNTRAANALNRRVDLGYAPASSRKAKTVAPPAAAEGAKSAPSVEPEAAPADCGAEFSRLFLSETIRFNGASARVAPGYAPFLDRLAQLLAVCTTYNLSIGGHTDRRGSEAANQRLSDARAKAVANALAARGVAPERMTAAGYAGQRPFDPGSSREAYALNRRVEFGVSDTRK